MSSSPSSTRLDGSEGAAESPLDRLRRVSALWQENVEKFGADVYGERISVKGYDLATLLLMLAQQPAAPALEGARTPEQVKDAWGEVEQLAIDAGVDGRAWMSAVATFWRVANLANEPIDAAAPITAYANPRVCGKCGEPFTAERPEVVVGDDACGHWKPRFSAHRECITITGNSTSPDSVLRTEEAPSERPDETLGLAQAIREMHTVAEESPAAFECCAMCHEEWPCNAVSLAWAILDRAASSSSVREDGSDADLANEMLSDEATDHMLRELDESAGGQVIDLMEALKASLALRPARSEGAPK